MPLVTGLITRRKAWAYGLIRKFTGRPARYGSAEWLALEDGCPEKIAGAVVAAEAWACQADTLEEDLRFEVEEYAEQAAGTRRPVQRAAAEPAHRHRHQRLAHHDG